MPLDFEEYFLSEVHHHSISADLDVVAESIRRNGICLKGTLTIPDFSPTGELGSLTMALRYALKREKIRKLLLIFWPRIFNCQCNYALIVVFSLIILCASPNPFVPLLPFGVLRYPFKFSALGSKKMIK